VEKKRPFLKFKMLQSALDDVKRMNKRQVMSSARFRPLFDSKLARVVVPAMFLAPRCFGSCNNVEFFHFQFLYQVLSFGMIVSSALMIWKGLMVVTGSESPIVVVLRFVMFASILHKS